jgi:hypothetical protein
MTAPSKSRRTQDKRGRRSLGWGVAVFVLLQVALSVAINQWLPALRDPEFGYKLARLRARREEEPDAPLLLVIGSSRSAMGLCPDAMRGNSTAGDTPLIFNFGMTGYGPIQELALLHRLLRAGIRPDRLLIEVHPLLLHQEGGYGEESWMNVGCLEWRDVGVMAPYLSHPGTVTQQWLRQAIAPWHSRRFLLLDRFASRWTAPEWKQNAWTLLDPYGWLPHYRESVTADEYEQGQARARAEYGGALTGFRITDAPELALRELLALCQRESIDVALFLMPESTGFRAFYPADARRQIDECLAGFCRKYGCRTYDATDWCADGDFWDGHHLLPGGAVRLSQRFAREIVPDLFDNQRRSHESLAHKADGPSSSTATGDRRR